MLTLASIGDSRKEVNRSAFLRKIRIILLPLHKGGM